MYEIYVYPVWKGKKIWHWKMSLPGQKVSQKTITNSSRKNEATGPKQKWCLAVEFSGGESKVWCRKEQYCIGIWNVRSMNQGKLDVVKQEMARLNIDILGISELKWTRIDELNSDGHYIYYCVQESLRRNGVTIRVNQESTMQYLDAISKMTEWSQFISKSNHSVSR